MIVNSENVKSYYRCSLSGGKDHLLWSKELCKLTSSFDLTGRHPHAQCTHFYSFTHNKHEQNTHTHTLSLSLSLSLSLRTAQTKHAFCLKLMCTLVSSFQILWYVLNKPRPFIIKYIDFLILKEIGIKSCFMIKCFFFNYTYFRTFNYCIQFKRFHCWNFVVLFSLNDYFTEQSLSLHPSSV